MPFIHYSRSYLQDLLISSVARGHWSTVIEIYRKDPESHKVVIPKSGDTAIHIAIANGLEPVTGRLVSLCQVEALAIGNEQGNTPLHLAAKVGSVRMCQCIAEKDSNLMGSRNENGETPLFVAASHGRINAFLCLHHICKQDQQHQYPYYRKNNGDTILHSAISQGHFEMAFCIILLYQELVDKVNVEGMLPLHLLASKPSSFLSGTHLRGLRKLAYHCLYVSKLNRRRYDATLFSNSNWLSSCLTTLPIDINDLPECCGKNRQLDEEGGNEQAIEPAGIFRSRCLGWCHARLLRLGKRIFKLLMRVSKLMLFIIGYAQYASLRDLKKRCVFSLQVVKQLLELSFQYEEQHGCYPPETTAISSYEYLGYLDDDDCDLIPKKLATTKMETPLLIAAKNGVVEIVEGILADYPDAIFDVNTEKKNIVMLAVENRHVPLYNFLLRDPKIMKNLFGHVDKEGNSVLHIAAKLGGKVDQDGNSALHVAATTPDRQPWNIRGAALQMHMEVKWYKFVKHSMPPGFFVRHNKDGQTPGQIFRDTHQKLIEEGRLWLTNNSQSCSVVAALITTVAFATSTTIPGGVKQDNGSPTLEHKPIFIISAVASLIALCSSMISVIMFLGILTSSFKHKDFRKDLPHKLLLGLISLLISIVSMSVSFFAGHYFVLKEELKHSATLVYALFCIPLVVFIIVKFPLDFEMVRVTLKKEPQQCRK